MLAARRKVAMRRGKYLDSSGEPGDRRTGYYVAGRDWPAIPNDLSISAFYEALEKIEDRDVEAAVKSLQVAGDRAEADE